MDGLLIANDSLLMLIIYKIVKKFKK